MFTLQANAHRAPGMTGGQGCDSGVGVGLGLLAAETAPHSQRGHHHPVCRQPEHVRDHGLGFAGVLGRGVDLEVPFAVGHGPADLRLQVEVVLRIHVYFAFEEVGGLAKGVGRIPPTYHLCFAVKRLGPDGRFEVEDGVERLVGDDHLLGAEPGAFLTLGHHPGDGLSPVGDFVLG